MLKIKNSSVWLTSVLVVLPVILLACSPLAPTPTATLPGDFQDLPRLYDNIAAEFSTLMTFKDSEFTTITSKAEFIVPPVSIEWMGNIFTGELKETVTGDEVFYQVHGSTSDDMLWLESVSYSKQVMRPDVNRGSFYRITLRNLSIGKTSNGVVTGLGRFERTGADIRKFVDKIEYIEGPVENGIIKPATTYLSSDWTNPTLNLKLSAGPGRDSIVDTVGLLQKDTTLTARLYVLINFEIDNAAIAFPIEFTIPPMTIAWKGKTFSGKTEKTGPGSDTVYQLNGAVSSDGLRLESLVYSRQIWRPGSNQGTFYKVTLKDVPIGRLVSGKVENLGKLDLAGPSVQRFVEKIEYIEGPLNVGQIIPTTNLISIEWANPLTQPALSLAFSAEAAPDLNETTPPKGGMMGK